MAQFQALARDVVADCRDAGRGAGPGRRLGALHAGRAGPLRVPRHRPRGAGPPRGRAGRGRVRRAAPAAGRRSTPRPPPGSSPPTAAAWCGRWRSWRSPAGRSARRCPTRRTSWSAPCRSASGSRGRSWTSGSSCGCAGCGTSGLVEEVRRLAGAGLREGRTAHRALGYQQVLAFLDGECSEQEAFERTVFGTRRFARRQESWFHKDPRIAWVDWDDPDRARLGRPRWLRRPARGRNHSSARLGEGTPTCTAHV